MLVFSSPYSRSVLKQAENKFANLGDPFSLFNQLPSQEVTESFKEGLTSITLSFSCCQSNCKLCWLHEGLFLDEGEPPNQKNIDGSIERLK